MISRHSVSHPVTRVLLPISSWFDSWSFPLCSDGWQECNWKVVLIHFFFNFWKMSISCNERGPIVFWDELGTGMASILIQHQKAFKDSFKIAVCNKWSNEWKNELWKRHQATICCTMAKWKSKNDWHLGAFWVKVVLNWHLLNHSQKVKRLLLNTCLAISIAGS